ncbi:MAG: hypothetical protein IPH62_03960 [Ignavibacteriae bacterium]|nr:hypothetical protein [Ignavibacteriota bacterium]
MIKLIIELARKFKVMKNDNAILNNSLSENIKEDRTIKIIAKEFSEFILKLQNNLERK